MQKPSPGTLELKQRDYLLGVLLRPPPRLNDFRVIWVDIGVIKITPMYSF